jgi:hypothetical protein
MVAAIRAVLDRWHAYRAATALAKRYTGASVDASHAASAIHTDRLAIIVELGLGDRFPVAAERRHELEIRDAALELEAFAYRHAAERAHMAASIADTVEFRRWLLDNRAARLLSDASAITAFCAAHPEHPGVLTFRVRVDLISAR